MPEPPFMVKMDIKGIDQLLRRVRDPNTIARPVTWGMRNSGLAVQAEAAKRAPVDQGRLRASIAVEIERRSPFPRWAKIGPGVFYAIFVELGTGIFGPKKRRIRPVSARALAWTARGGKRFVRASVAGMRARPFMAPGFEAAKGRIDLVWREVGRRIVQGFAGR